MRFINQRKILIEHQIPAPFLKKKRYPSQESCSKKK